MPEVDPGEEHYGTPGPRISRQAAFLRGFLGALGVLVAVLLALAAREAASVLVLVLISMFLAVGLDPVVAFVVHRGAPRWLAVGAVTVLFLGVIAVFVIVVGGELRSQLASFVDDAPHLLNDLRRNRTVAHLDSKYHFISAVEDKIQSPDFVQNTFGGVFDVGLAVVNFAASALIVFVLTVYFLAALPQLRKSAYSLAPASRRERVSVLGDEILRRVGGYVIGAVAVAFIAGVVSAIFLLCVGLGEYALPLALLVAMLDLVPLVGSLVGASVIVLVGFATSLPVGIAALAFYFVYEILEGYVIYPRIMRSSIDVPEYVTIIAVLIGGAVGGIVGALLAVPVGAALLLLVREVWVRRQDTV